MPASMILEMHSHTAEHSPCSSAPAVELVRWAFRMGLDGIVLTDHHFLWPQDKLASLRAESGVPEHFVLLTAQEVGTGRGGDILVYGAPATLPAGMPLARLRREYPDAALVWAHPYRNGAKPTAERLLSPLLDAVEIFNSNHSVSENNRALLDWHRLKFTAMAGTDTHGLTYTGNYPTHFDHPVHAMQELVTELKMGRCRPFFKEIRRSGTSDTQVYELAMGTKGQGGVRRKLIVKRHEDLAQWNRAERASRIMEAIARRGFDRGEFRIPVNLGKDRSGLFFIEQAIQGKSLYQALVSSSEQAARGYLQMTGWWLAHLHNLNFCVTPAEEFYSQEKKRLLKYVSILFDRNHRHRQRVREIMQAVLEREEALFRGRESEFTQGHGDFHPKNVYVGKDAAGAAPFIAAIDLDSSHCMPQAFDVGTFVAQYRNQLYARRDIIEKVPIDLFLDAYLQTIHTISPHFLKEVSLYRARANLSIIYLLVKVGLGESENLWRVIVESEKALIDK